MSRRLIILGIAFCLGCCSSLWAEEIRPQAREISLDEASRLALINNFDIQLTKYDIQISRQGLDSAKSIYDTILDAALEYDNNQLASNSTLAASESDNRDYLLGLTKKLPTGTTLSVDQGSGRGWTTSSAVIMNPAYESSFGVTIEQELGRNFFGRQDRGSVKVAMKDVQNAEFVSLDKIEATLAVVQKSYWNLVLMHQVDEIRQEMLEQARRLYEVDQERIKHGLIETPDLLGSEANYQTRLSDLVLSRDVLSASGNLLKLQLNVDPDDVELTPASVFELTAPSATVLDALKLAYENRRDYQAAMNEIERRDILVVMKKDAALPELNLKASLKRNGIDDDFEGSVNKVSEEDNPEFFAGLSFSMPLENREAGAAFKEAEYAKAKALLNAKYLERKIAIEIQDQVRSCSAAYERLELLQKAAELQTKKALEQERIFKQGRSSSDTVIRYQEDALFARIEAAQAFYAYYASLIELKRRQGTLLKEYWDGAI